MKNKYVYNKNFLLITITLIFPIYFIIRECDYPLLWNNKLFLKLFTCNHSEKLLYNLSISYIAAYIFYIFQVYLPQVSGNYHSVRGLNSLIQKEIKAIKLLMYIIDVSIEKTDSNNIYFKKSVSSIYILINDRSVSYIKRFTFSTTLDDAINELTKLNNQIHSSSYFNNLDPYITNLLSSIPFDNLYQILYTINSNITSTDNYAITHSDTIENIEKTIALLEKNPYFNTLFYCKPLQNHKLEQKYNSQIKDCSLNELYFTLPIIQE